MSNVSLDIWQFVRVMVHLETAPARFPHISDDWADAWHEVDAELSRLANSDFDAYSAMMMESQIDLPWSLPEHGPELLKLLKGVSAEMRDIITDKASDRQTRQDLAFERSEIERLRQNLFPK